MAAGSAPSQKLPKRAAAWAQLYLSETLEGCCAKSRCFVSIALCSLVFYSTYPLSRFHLLFPTLPISPSSTVRIHIHIHYYTQRFYCISLLPSSFTFLACCPAQPRGLSPLRLPAPRHAGPIRFASLSLVSGLEIIKSTYSQAE